MESELTIMIELEVNLEWVLFIFTERDVANITSSFKW
jgi:hypothetical protein